MKEVNSFLGLIGRKSFIGRQYSKKILSLALMSCTSMSMVLGQKIQLKGDQMSLESVFNTLKKQSGYSVFVRKDILDGARPVDFDGTVMSIEEVLNHALANQGLDYKINGREVILSRKSAIISSNLGGYSTSSAKSQNQVLIYGIVVDQKGYPVVNATIHAKKSGAKSMTNEAGRFSLNVHIPDQLVISILGYETQTLAIENTQEKRVVLTEKSIQMQDVVVNGIFSRPRENFTGSATTIKGEDLKKISPNNLFKAISAIEPSFQLVVNNVAGGNINRVPEIQLRGQNSFPNLTGELAQNPNQPLFILDGFEVGIERMMDLDMNLIADITILKDASATSVYGSRAANGVMIVKTLVPESGKFRVTVNNDFSINTPDLGVYHFMNAKEKLDFEQRAMFYSAYRASFDMTEDLNLLMHQMDQLYNERLKAAEGGINTNWLRIPVQTGLNNRTTLYLSGGDNVIRYGIHAMAGWQNGVMKNQDRRNYSGQFDFSYNTGKLLFQNSVRIYQNKANESNYGNFLSYAQMNPYWSPYDNEGKIKYYLEDFGFVNGTASRITNPLFNATLNTKNATALFVFQNNFQIRYNMFKELFMDAQFSVGKEFGKRDQFLPAQHTSFEKVVDAKQKGSYSKINNEALNYEVNATANFNKYVGKSLFMGTLGFNLSSRSSESYRVRAVGFGYDKLDNLLYATQYEPNARPSGDESVVNRVGILFNGNYSYDNRYLLDLSIRRDGSSQYGVNERFGTFWSLGGGWNLHKESFLKTVETINRLKIRSSYGSTGSLNIPAYSSQTRFSFLADNTYAGELGAIMQNIGNPNLGWQEKREWNIGADISLLGEKLDLRIDHYRGITNNTITPITLAPSVGFSSYMENLGKIKNRGYEFTARYKLLEDKEKGMSWSIFVNGAHNKNSILEISNFLKQTNESLNTLGTNNKQTMPNIQFREGESLNTIYAVRSLGIDPATGDEIYLDLEGRPTTMWSALNKVAVGVTDPVLRGTFGTSIYYKGFDLNVLAEYRFGGKMYNQTLADRVENADITYNVDRRAYDFGWAQPGDQSIYRFISFFNINQPTHTTSRFVQKDNLLNISSLSLGYTFMKQYFMKRLGLNSLKVTATTNDLVRFSSIDIERGIDNPFYRSYNLSLRVSF